MLSLVDRVKWKVWRHFPEWMPDEIQAEILKLSPFVCEQIGQGNPMIVMRREVWNAGEYEVVPGAPMNIEGVYWIIREWLREHPEWRPSAKRSPK
mgnify:CR=1 FL=1